MFGDYSNIFTLEFSTEENECLKDLRVNINLLTNYSPSRWYDYYKRITVIDNGKVLVPKIQEQGIAYYSIEAFMPTCNLHYHFSGDNTYSSSDINVNYKYIYSKDKIYLKWRIGGDEGESNIKYLQKDYLEALPLHSTRTDLYLFDGLSDRDIGDIARLYTFEELLQEDKLLESDINRLPHLSDEQKQLLIKAHEDKRFREVDSNFFIYKPNSL